MTFKEFLEAQGLSTPEVDFPIYKYDEIIIQGQNDEDIIHTPARTWVVFDAQTILRNLVTATILSGLLDSAVLEWKHETQPLNPGVAMYKHKDHKDILIIKLDENEEEIRNEFEIPEDEVPEGASDNAH